MRTRKKPQRLMLFFRPDSLSARPRALPRRPLRMAVDVTTQLQQYDLVIGGENVPAASGETFDTVSPTTNEPVGRMAKAGHEDVERAVAAARKAFDEGPWPRMTPLERSRIMHKIAMLLRDRLAEIAVVETTNCGKIIVESRSDVTASANCFEYYAGL